MNWFRYSRSTNVDGTFYAVRWYSISHSFAVHGDSMSSHMLS